MNTKLLLSFHTLNILYCLNNTKFQHSSIENKMQLTKQLFTKFHSLYRSKSQPVNFFTETGALVVVSYWISQQIAGIRFRSAHVENERRSNSSQLPCFHLTRGWGRYKIDSQLCITRRLGWNSERVKDVDE